MPPQAGSGTGGRVIDKLGCEARALGLVAQGKLGHTAYVVFACLVHKANEGAGKAVILTRDIASGTGLAKRTVKAALTALVRAKLIARRPRYNKRRRNSKLASEYRVLVAPRGAQRPGTLLRKERGGSAYCCAARSADLDHTPSPVVTDSPDHLPYPKDALVAGRDDANTALSRRQREEFARLGFRIEADGSVTLLDTALPKGTADGQ